MQEIKREGTLKKTLTSLEFHIQQFFILQGFKMLLSGLAYDKVYYVTDWTKTMFLHFLAHTKTVLYKGIFLDMQHLSGFNYIQIDKKYT